MDMMCMITALGIELSSVLIWAFLGLACGIMAALIWGGKRMLFYDLVIGLVAGCGGGCASMIALGDDNVYQFELATLTAIFFAALALFLFGWFASRH